MKVDKQTAEQLSEGEKWERLVRGDDWAMIREKLLLVAYEAIDLSLVPLKFNEEIFVDLKVRQEVHARIMRVVQDIEGNAFQSQSNKTAFMKDGIDSYITRVDA